MATFEFRKQWSTLWGKIYRYPLQHTHQIIYYTNLYAIRIIQTVSLGIIDLSGGYIYKELTQFFPLQLFTSGEADKASTPFIGFVFEVSIGTR